MSGDEKPARKTRPGTFDSKRAKEAAAKRGKGKQPKSKVERLAEAVYERILADPNVPEYVKKDVAKDVLNRRRGTPVSAAQMGTIERPDGEQPQYGDVPARRATHGVIILPAEDPELDFSQLTPEELATFERLRDKVMGKPYEPRPSIAEQLEEGRRQSDEWHQAHPSPAIASDAAPSESPAATENAPPTQPQGGAEVIPMFPTPPAPAGLDTITNDRLWPEKEPA